MKIGKERSFSSIFYVETAARVSSDKLGLFYGDGGRKFAFDSIIVLIVVEQTLSSKMFVKIILYCNNWKA